MKFIMLFLFIVIVFAFAVLFGANNNQPVVFDYFISHHEFRLSTLSALLLGLGFVVGWFTTGIFYLVTRFKLRHIQKKLKKIENMYETEVANNRRLRLLADDPILPT